MTSSRVEDVYVLYGSQTGNSEQAAIDLCAQVDKKLNPQEIQKLARTKEEIQVVAKHMQLDDFLELERAKWTRLVVIITSSYGVGQAPLGCYRFRQLCDEWKQDPEQHRHTLDGIQFAMCGLGDSKYTTFFENPTVINETLHLVGAKRVGLLGKADASSKEMPQTTVIEKWRDGIWPHLATVVAQPPLDPEKLKEMQLKTVRVCQKINPDFDANIPKSSGPMTSAPWSMIVALLATVMGVYYATGKM